MMRRFAGVLVLVATIAAGADGLGAQVSAPPTSQPSLDLPAELDRVLRDYERHWSAGEAAALSELFVPEGLIVSSGRWIRGRDAIREAYANASGPLRLRAIEFATEGETGFIVGAYGYGGADPTIDLGMFTLTLRRGDDGMWLIVSDMDRQAG